MTLPPLLTLHDISVSFGGNPVLANSELVILPAETVCLVGRNGSGKSTLLKIAAGLCEFDNGHRFVKPGTVVRYLPQEPDLSRYPTLIDYVLEGLEQGHDQHRAEYLLQTLDLDSNAAPDQLSGGEVRRAALARTLAPKPDVILLDEPTNHLDVPTIEWLESELRNLRSSVVLISHDRRFLENLSSATIWLDRGKTRRLDKGFSFFESWRDTILEQEDTTQKKLARKIIREEHWLRYGVTARRKRNIRRLEGLQNLRTEKHNYQKKTGDVKFQDIDSAVSGKLIIEAIDVFKHFGERTVVNKFSVRVKRGERIAIVGPNGAGKTTLLNILTGGLKPDSGKIRLGGFLEIATMDQNREMLDAEWTVGRALTGDHGDFVDVRGKSRHVIGYMRDFLFSADMLKIPISLLSGGERGRLMLARALAVKSNLLVLDEPTNDLDLETLDLLQEVLTDYPGTIILVSHDRDFVDRVASSVLAVHENGVWLEYAGGYNDMVLQRGYQLDSMHIVGRQNRSRGNKEKKPVRPVSAKLNTSLSHGIQKITYKEKYNLEQTSKKIDRLTKLISDLENLISAPDSYDKDPDSFVQNSKKLEQAKLELLENEDEWLALELKIQDMKL